MNDNVVRLPSARPTQRSVQGTLALQLLPDLDRPAHVPPARPHDAVTVDEQARRRLDAFAAAYLRAAVEVAMGNRPAGQLLRHTSDKVMDDLRQRALALRSVSARPHAPWQPPSSVRPQVMSVRTSMVRADAAEASAHVRYGSRSRAIAARFEVVRGRWQCVVLQFS